MQPFLSRRKQLQQSLGSHEALLIQQPKPQRRNGDVDFPFHPNRYFYYLTGFEEPSAYLLITPTKTHLYSCPFDAKKSLWDGANIGEKSIKQLGIDTWSSIFEQKSLATALSQIETLYLLGTPPENIRPPKNIIDGHYLVDKMRTVKDDTEITAITQACQISAKAHNHVMANAKHQQHEAGLYGLFVQKTAEAGALSQAYPPIVASGRNACTLHYQKNNATIHAQDLVLIDAGCEYAQYASDITRTFPHKGQFSKNQQALYEACLDVQKRTISKVKPGLSLQALHTFSVQCITEHLIDLKLISLNLESALETEQYRDFFPHKIGHFIGLDVHDVGNWEKPLEPNMVITVEPGIYIPEQSIGIRIEDCILVTTSGHKNLTDDAVKDIKDIEHLMTS